MGHVELRETTKKFGSVEVIRGIDLSVEKGQFCALLGPSGCGKSTLLRLIAGLEPVTSGQVYINQRNVTAVAPSKRQIAMVFQSYALYPHMNVRDNISFSLDVSGVSKEERYRRADEVAQLLQLQDLMDRRPAQLSGGQRQRVAIGRSLVRDPEVFLFDEPLSNLDAMLRVQMRLEIANLHQELETTMIYVTHDQVEAMTLADTIVVLDHGTISQAGAPLELYRKPANKFVASFIGSPSMNFLQAGLTRAEGRDAVIDLSGAGEVAFKTRAPIENAEGGKFELGVRPEHVGLCAPDDARAAVRGRARLVERLGNSTLVYIESDAGTLTAELSGEAEAAIGDNVGVTLDVDQLHLFDEAAQAV